MRTPGGILIEEHSIHAGETFGEHLGRAEVEHAQPVAGEHEEIARMQVGVHQARGVERPPDGEDQQARDTEALLRGRVRVHEVEQRLSPDPLQAEDAPRAALVDDGGNHQLRVALRRDPVGVRLRRLLDVVQLAQQRCPELFVVRTSVQGLPRQREPAHQNGGVRQIVLERLLDARVLHLHHHFAAVAQPRGVDLAERCRRHRLPLEVREQLVGMPPELRLDDRVHRRPSACSVMAERPTRIR